MVKFLEGEEPTLIDSCGGTNLITIFAVARAKLKYQEFKSPISIAGVVPNSTMNSKGIINRTIKLGADTVTLPFNVVETLPTKQAEILIGYPSFRSLKVEINSERVLLRDIIHPICHKEVEVIRDDQEDRLVPIYTKALKTLPRRKAVFVEIHFNQRFVSTRPDVLLTPAEWIIDTPGLSLTIGKVTSETKKVELRNYTDTEIELPKQTLIGYLTTGQYQLLVMDIDDEESCFMPASTQQDKLWDRKKLNQIIKEKSNLRLTKEQLRSVKSLIRLYQEIFSLNPRGPGVTTKTQADVTVNDPNQVPIRLRPYRYSAAALVELKRQVNEMLRNDIIRKSNSAWAFPVVLAIKADGTWRFCIDYSKLNAVVKKDAYALPRTDDYLDRLAKAKYVTIIDLASGFWQIPMREQDREKLAFITPFGNYEPNVLPFGFTNAPAIFQRAISETLSPHLDIRCLVYIDDIAIFSADFETHLDDCELVFRELAKFKWKIKIEKCQFFCYEFDYLGHHIGEGFIKPLERNIDKLKKMKKLEKPEHIVSFLGFMGYYKRFIDHYDDIVYPLRQLAKSPVWSWTEEVNDAYHKLVQCLTVYPILRLPDPSRPFIVRSDASHLAWGAVLAQVYDHTEFIVSYASGTLVERQCRWEAWKLECYGAMKSILTWQVYLLGTLFYLVTDHLALKAILNLNHSEPSIIARWKLALAPFKFIVVHRPGKLMVIEDMMSRWEPFTPPVFLNELTLPQPEPITIKELADGQKKDPLLNKMIIALRDNLLFDPDIEKETRCNANHFVLENEMLYYLETHPTITKRRILRLAVSDEDLNRLLISKHNSPLAGHLGPKRLWIMISSLYWTPKLYSKVMKYYADCKVCQMNRTLKNHNSQMLHVTADEPCSTLQMDHIVMEPPSEDYHFVLTVVCVFSGKVWFLPTKTQSAIETLNKLLEYIFLPNRFPKEIITDGGTGFINELVDELKSRGKILSSINLAGIKVKGATGAVENKNKLYWSILRKYINQVTQDNWKFYCFLMAYSYNKSPHPKLDNYSPDFIFSGLNPFEVVDFAETDEPLRNEEFHYYRTNQGRVWEVVRKATAEYHKNMDSSRTNYLNGRKPKTYKVGDAVMIKRRPEWLDSSLKFKAATKNVGPFEIMKTVPDRNHVVIGVSAEESRVIHVDDIALFDGEVTVQLSFFNEQLEETIIMKEIPKKFIEPAKLTDLMLPNSNNYDVKTIVGKIIALWWPSFKTYQLGTIIGFTNNHNNNLIYYNENLNAGVDVDERDNYYKCSLFPTKQNPSRKGDKWFLVDDTKLILIEKINNQ